MHALCGLFVLPMALRFPHRPILLVTAQCLMLCLFKPYPSVADHALYMALLPLLQVCVCVFVCVCDAFAQPHVHHRRRGKGVNEMLMRPNLSLNRMSMCVCCDRGEGL
jgi:hypothetical protein